MTLGVKIFCCQYNSLIKKMGIFANFIDFWSFIMSKNNLNLGYLFGKLRH